MFRTAAAAAALGLTAGLYLSTGTAMAEPENSTVTTEHPAADGNAAAGIHITDAKPEDNSLINQRNGNVITLEMVQNDAKWKAEAAEMLKRDNTSEVAR
jgi:hypothetical protein